MATNPFTLMFGKEPNEIIRRDDLIAEIANDFSSKNPSSQAYLLLGARGAGKTVLLSELYKHFEAEKDWIVVDVNPHRDILEDLASGLYENGKTKHLFLHGSFDFSFQGLSFHLEGKDPVSSIPRVVTKMLEYLKDKNKKVLITLDEVTTNEKVKEFIHDFQSFTRKDYQIYLIMTGLYENVVSLQNDKSMTFLYRTRQILLEPLDLVAIKNSYMVALGVDESTAKQLSELTKGYGFGYQLLGYLYFKHPSIDNELLEQYDSSLRINAYNKIWSSITGEERKVISCLKEKGEASTADILKKTGFSSKLYSVYRSRLLLKGVLVSKERGTVSLALPRFREFVIEEEEE